eukprot:TRINITY_DN11593_c0_g1_i1.p1 TRINITY_DN11593_c0_g1~~TRINITY_DN11593_c0_g1_i1.p1  ORF type:complete len:227 (+),score=30.39 TRINITY_DN11593_c0_g1_i1:33-683(+)
MTSSSTTEAKIWFKLPELPYGMNDLNPYIGEEIIKFHYGKHHQGYVNTLNDLAKTNTALQGKTVDELVRTLDAGKPFNMAAQVWNHTFYWNSMTPKSSGKPKGTLAQAIDKRFGSFDEFVKVFSATANGHFGSGWAWLIVDAEGKLQVIDTHDAGNPLSKNDNRGIPLLTCDVWEHSYYAVYRNDRAGYTKSWFQVVNWEFAEKNFTEAVKQLAKL